MNQDTILTIMQLTVRTVIITSAPPLMLGLIVGLVVSIFQTITSIHEQTLAFVPKILAVFISLLLFGNFMLTTLQELFVSLYSNLATYIR